MKFSRRAVILFIVCHICLAPCVKCESPETLDTNDKSNVDSSVKIALTKLLSEPTSVGSYPSSSMTNLQIQEIKLRTMLITLKSLNLLSIDPNESNLLALLEEKREIELKLIKCLLIINKINQISNAAPTNEQILSDSAEGLKALLKDSKKESTTQNIVDGLKFAKAIDSISSAIEASSKLSQLQPEFRHAQEELANKVDRFAECIKTKSNKPLKALASIGVIIGSINNEYYLHTVDKNSAADKAGLRKGDKILEIDGVSTDNMTLSQVRESLHGKMQSIVSIGLERSNRLKSIKVTRSTELSMIDYKTSMGDIYNGDSLSLTNFVGMSLTNCCIAVEVHYQNSGADRYIPHLHFIDEWKANEKQETFYPIESEYHFSESPFFPEEIKVWIMSDQGSFYQTLTFAGPYRDLQLQEFCNTISFDASYTPPSVGFFESTHGKVEITFAGASFLRPSSVTVFTVGDPLLEETSQSISKTFTLDQVLSDDTTIENLIFDSKPSSIIIELKFHKSQYIHKVKIPIK